MKTSCFFTYQGPGRISIARWSPRGMSGYRTYKALAPRRDMLKMPYEQYLGEYLAMLAELDPAQVVEDLKALAGPAEAVLLCWERAPLSETNFCHRTMVADWLERARGIVIPEL